MAFVETLRRLDVPFSPERPRNVERVVLPEVEIPVIGQSVRLAMHTDNITGVLNFLRSLPASELSSLQVEGRVLTDEQFARLTQHPAYRFFMSGRLQRVADSAQTEILAYVLPRDFDISTEEARRLIALPFSPSTLARDLNYQTGWRCAEGLVQSWLESGNPNTFIPMLGACNEFNIGSDTLSSQRLEEIAAAIQLHLAEQQLWVSRTLSTPLARFSTTIPLSNPFPKSSILEFKNQKDFRRIEIIKNLNGSSLIKDLLIMSKSNKFPEKILFRDFLNK